MRSDSREVRKPGSLVSQPWVLGFTCFLGGIGATLRAGSSQKELEKLEALKMLAFGEPALTGDHPKPACLPVTELAAWSPLTASAGSREGEVEKPQPLCTSADVGGAELCPLARQVSGAGYCAPLAMAKRPPGCDPAPCVLCCRSCFSLLIRKWAS